MKITVKCPNCANEFPVEEIIAHRIKEKIELDFQVQFSELKQAKADISKQQNQIDEAILKGVALKMRADRAILEKQLRSDIELEKQEQMKSYEEQLKAQSEKTRGLLKRHADLEKIARENETLKEQLEAEFQTRLTKEVANAKQKMKSDIEKSANLKIEDIQKEANFKLAEFEVRIAQLKTKIKDAQKNIDQSSMQVQGQAGEVSVVDILKSSYPDDLIEPYGKGQQGADILLTVRNSNKDDAGKILIEIKRTKTFSKAWIEKLKGDCRKVNHQFVFPVIITESYPAGITKMSQMSDIWVVSFNECEGLIAVIRETVLLLHEMNTVQKNRGTSLEQIHKYLSSSSFKNTVESIINTWTVLKTDLDKEKSVITGYWKAREVQLGNVLTQTSEMYHSIRAILGGKLPAIKQLDGTSSKKLIG